MCALHWNIFGLTFGSIAQKVIPTVWHFRQLIGFQAQPNNKMSIVPQWQSRPQLFFCTSMDLVVCSSPAALNLSLAYILTLFLAFYLAFCLLSGMSSGPRVPSSAASRARHMVFGSRRGPAASRARRTARQRTRRGRRGRRMSCICSNQPPTILYCLSCRRLQEVPQPPNTQKTGTHAND